MDTPPRQRIDIPNHGNFQPEQEMLKLRKRLNDLLRLGAATPETFQQAIQQMWQETEKRRQGALQEAEDHLRRYHALVAQAHGFSSMASVMYAVIDGYVSIEERRLQELAEREAEREKAEAEAAEDEDQGQDEPSGEQPSADTQEAPPVEEKSAGGKRKKS